jgi:AraC family transcriptional regulator of adaptative response/methylated-DNA-[protein]-cysteine methyltransferase
VSRRDLDYTRIARAIEFIAKHGHRQPHLSEIAAHVNMSEYHFQRLFSRWAGVTPKRFLQILTVDRAKRLLREARPLLEVSNELGLSSGSRLYDHFVNIEAVTPGEFSRHGEGLSIAYGVHETPFGRAFIAVTRRGICRLSFLDPEGIDTHREGLIDTWPRADVTEDGIKTASVIRSVFTDSATARSPLSVHVSGTNFQASVWRALLQIPPGEVRSYSQVASAVGKPSAVRAVGQAIGANPVAYLIPCHRVIRQNGELGGYHWGVTRKRAMQAWEQARQPA